MLWGTFSWAFQGPVVVVEQTMNATGYLNIIADQLHPYMASVFPAGNGMFQQDNAPCHKAKIVLEWFQEHNAEFQLMSWCLTHRISIRYNTFGMSWYSSNEAHFWLNGYIKKQIYRIWSEANPQVYVETPLHPEKLTVWCALWAGGIIVRGASQLPAAVNFHLVRRFADLEKTQCFDKDPPLCQPHHLHSHHSHLLSHFSKIQTGQNLSLAIHEIYLPQLLETVSEKSSNSCEGQKRSPFVRYKRRNSFLALPMGSREINCNSQHPLENHPRPENCVAKRVGPIASATQKLPYFQHKIMVRDL
ncbi:transposase domain containing protein [Trichonephila clavipes]|nr:transposase domain containing protein [Trichonephila clavipes]